MNIIKQCKFCNKEFNTTLNKIKVGRGKYCSKKCSIDSQRKFPKNFKCEYCKTLFPNKEGRLRKYCSKKCQNNGRRGCIASVEARKKMSEAKKGKIPKNFGITFLYKGKDNNHWKGGITKIVDKIRKSEKYKQWRTLVYKRDNYTCQKCKNNSRALQAHHIKPFSKIVEENNIKTINDSINCEELWYINNGITLCKECHKKTDSYLNRW